VSQEITNNDARIERAAALLPAWFIPRMMEDHWTFGLLLVTSDVLVIENITDVHQAADGGLWIDVQLSGHDGFIASSHKHPGFAVWRKLRMLSAPTDRLSATVNAAHIVAALELSDS
jgi:hypothetical protein